MRGSVLYHCGPVSPKPRGEGGPVSPKPRGEGGWRITAAGPTTSIREEPYQAAILERYGVRVVIGKGGMGGKTLAGLKKSGGVYLNAIGGAAQFYARCIDRVAGVSLLQFGTPGSGGTSTSQTFRRSSRWTRTATACTRRSRTRQARNSNNSTRRPRPSHLRQGHGGGAGASAKAARSGGIDHQLARPSGRA
jgi:hypothetical protein